MKWKIPGLFALAMAAVPAPSHAVTFASDGILWETCPSNLKSLAGPLSKRLQCGVMLAPRDWRQQNSVRDRPVGIIRIAAGSRAKRQGTLFLNFGGPGLHPAPGITGLGAEWQATDALDPVQGVKRRILQQFDLVTVVPRGLDANESFECPMMDNFAANTYFLGERSDGNWNALVAAAHGHADDCSAVPDAMLMNSEQHVRDMERVRALLGEDKLNFYGASYGGWVGSLYGSLFPGRVGRMVLDSSVDASGTMERFHLLRPHWRERDLARLVTMPAARRADFWGLGSDSRAIRSRLQDMPMLLRALWSGHILGPADVVAALQVADMYAAEPEERRTRSAMQSRISGHRFHDRINQTVSKVARQLVDVLPERSGTLPITYGWPAVTLATYCNDGRWKSTPAGIRAALGGQSEFASFDEGDSSLLMLICSRWPRGEAAVPSMASLRTAPEFLMIHGDHDRTTPLKGALSMIEELPNARLVVVEDLAGHGVMTSSSNCAIKAAGEFLLTGALPAAAHSTCDNAKVVPVPPSHGEL